MATTHLAGILASGQSERTYINIVGQRVVYDEVKRILAEWSAELTALTGTFVHGTTSDHEEKFKNLGSGRMQKQGTLGQAGVKKPQGDWVVAYPLYQFGEAQGWDDVTMGYMNIEEFDRQLDAVMASSISTMRYEILHRLMDNVSETIDDTDLSGDSALIIKPLANGDTDVYPPVAGSEQGATADHYIGFNYLTGAISDTNNPVETLVDLVAPHFGGEPEGMELITFINGDERASIEALADFVGIADTHIKVGDDTAVLNGVPVGNIPGQIIGRTNSSWISEWAWMPSAYLFTMALGEVRPLKMRVDPAGTGLSQALSIVSGSSENFPLHDAQYRMRFGFGAYNRLNGAAGFLVASSSYTVPSAYD